jgi:adenylyltransferase/sulfurtransferase
MSSLSNEELLRYARQIVLPEFGKEGQEKIKQAKILVIGLGGLGTFSSLLLAETGIGYLRIVDRDLVEKSNLHRTPLYSESDLDRAKVEVAADRLKQLNPSITIDTHATHLGANNIDSLIDDIDLVIDALDNFETRRIVNEACNRKRIPVLFCGVSARSGNISVFNLKKSSPCLSCLYHEIDDEELESCDITGIHPALLPVVTGIQIHEALQIILKKTSSLDGILLFIDLNNMSFDKIPIYKNESCSICSKPVKYVVTSFDDDYRPLKICGNNNYMLIPNKSVDFDIVKVKQQLENHYEIKKMGTHSVTLLLPPKDFLTIFKGGNVLIRGRETIEQAMEVWDEIRKKYIV